MPDLFEQEVGTSDFALPGDSEILGRQVEEPGQEAPTDQPPPPEEPPARPRDPETGQFVAAEQPEPEEEPESDEELPTITEAPVEDDELQAYLDKYGGDQEKALRAAVEAQKLIGRQGAELKEYRDALDERFSQLEEKIAPPAPPPSYDIQQVQEHLAEYPAKIPEVAAAAFREGNREVLTAAMVAWQDYDPYAAEGFRMDMAAATAHQVYQQTEDGARQVEQTWNQTAEKFAKDHPDFPTFAPKMREIAPQYPWMQQMLEQGGPDAQREALDFLYTKARGLHGDTPAPSAQDPAAATAADADRAIEEAAVTSGQAGHAERQESPAEQMGRIWQEKNRPYDEGWNLS